MSSLTVSTHESTAALADKLRGFGAKVLARIVGTSPDTTKKWLSASNAPTWRHTVVMLNDPVLAPCVLAAAGREDLVQHQQTITALMDALAQVKADADANQARLNDLVYLSHDLRTGGVRPSGEGSARGPERGDGEARSSRSDGPEDRPTAAVVRRG